MRGYGVGVGDVGEVSGGAWDKGDTACHHDRCCSRADPVTGMVGGYDALERDAASQRCRDRIGVCDGARGKHGACIVHWQGAGGAHRVRGDGVGVGDVGEVQGITWRSRDEAGGDDSWSARRERDAGMVI